MAFQKNFVVKNGIEVNDNLIFADKNQNTVGIGTTITPEKVQVNGGIGATSIVLTGVGTIPTLKSSNALISNGYINVGLVTSITGTGLTYTTGNFGIVNVNKVNAVSGVVTNLSGTISTYTNSYSTVLNAGTVLTPNLYAVSGVVTSVSGSSLNYTNIIGSSLSVSGVSTVGSLSIGSTQVISSGRQLQNIVSLDSTTTSTIQSSIIFSSNFENLSVTGIATIGSASIGVAGIGTLSVTGISTLGNLTITPVGSGATVGSYSGVVTYYGDASGLTNVPASNPAGSDTQVQYNNAGVFAGSNNFTFNGATVTIGSTITINSTGINAPTGIITANTFSGSFNGSTAIFSGNSSGNIVRITQTGTGNALLVEDSANPDTTPFVVTGIGSVGIGTSAPINTLDVHGTIRAARQDAVSSGGEIVFARASDNANAWALDVEGNDFRVTDSSQGATRIHIGSGGNVGLGSTATSRLHVFGNAIVTGILTATSFVGDGSGLSNLFTGIGINTSGGNVGYGVTTLDFRGSGISTVTVSSGIATINVEGGALSVTDDTSTDSTFYPVFVNSTTGVSTQTSVSSTNLYFNPSTGNLSSTEFTSLSDETRKTNIRTIENPIEIAKQLRGVKFNWIDNSRPSVGVIAQEVEKVLPELVTNDNVKSVNYSGLIGILIEAIKEQQIRIEELERKLNA